jgi:RNA polymerase sigma-70 factor (ECF subfamily)
LRFAVRMLGDRDDADDALQQTFLRAYRSLGKYQERDRFSAWLYRILVNQCRSAASRRSQRERVFVREEVALLNAADRHQGSTGEDEELMRRILAELDPLLREAFVLKYVEDLSYEEMSAATGVGVSALKMRAKRACDRLRARWEQIRDD